MSRFGDFRAKPQPKAEPQSSIVSLVVSALGAFAVGGLLVFGWPKVQPLLPSFTSNLLPSADSFSFSAGAGRIGQAAAAPLLRSCITDLKVVAMIRELEGKSVNPSAVYATLKSGSLQVGLVGMVGMSATTTQAAAEMSILLAYSWGELADCIYAREARFLCDPDNRAAAVESVTKFLYLARQKVPAVRKEETVVLNGFMRDIEGTKRRLSIALGRHGRDGSIVLSDFGFSVPAEISEIMREVKPIRNACAGLPPAKKAAPSAPTTALRPMPNLAEVERQMRAEQK